MTDSLLSQCFQHVRQIDGPLTILNNNHILTLACFRSLVNTSALFVVGNADLVDARMPSLLNTTSIVVSNNLRLCALNYPLGPGGCSLIDVVASFFIQGITAAQFTPAQQSLLAQIVQANVTVNISAVCSYQCA